MPKQKAVTLGSLIDELYLARDKRIEQQREVDAKKVIERQIQAQIMDMLDKQGITSSRGKVATASITSSTKPTVDETSWKKVYDYIHKHKAFHLLQKRIAVEAWRELHESGIKVPGIVADDIKDLSLTKATKG